MNVPAPLDQTPEERELAQRLARLGPRGEPSPQLDARVLAAARAALDPVPAPPHRSRRWPVALGLAASLVLAVGVAWRLRPLPPGTTAELAVPTRPAAQVQTAPPASEPVPAAAAVAQTASDAGASANANANANASVIEPPPDAAPRRAAKSVAAPPPALDEQVEVDVPAPAVVLDVPSPAAAPQPPQKTEASQGMADAAASANADDAVDRAATSPAEPETGDEPLDAMPPATADAPGVRDAWLSRIRALIDSGDIAGGRHSLHAFVERYPDYPLPEDLRALQQ